MSSTRWYFNPIGKLQTKLYTNNVKSAVFFINKLFTFFEQAHITRTHTHTYTFSLIKEENIRYTFFLLLGILLRRLTIRQVKGIFRSSFKSYHIDKVKYRLEHYT